MLCYVVFFFKQKTAYELRISDWSSDVCSSDLISTSCCPKSLISTSLRLESRSTRAEFSWWNDSTTLPSKSTFTNMVSRELKKSRANWCRSEEHTSELQSLMRISYAVFCLKKKITNIKTPPTIALTTTLLLHDTQKMLQ